MATRKDAPNREELFNLAVEAAKNKNFQSARVMFRQVLGEDKRNTRAMMWMAKMATTQKEREQWLKKAIEVNPNHEQALAMLHKMAHSGAASRNKLLFRLGIGAYVAVVLVLSFFIMFTTAVSG
jgi:TolA-binding protein